MPKLPPSSPDDVVRVVKRIGFAFDRQKGSHAVYIRSTDGLRIVIPMHRRELKTGTLRGLVSDMKISVERYIELLAGRG
jgi:predicted RNA binding protein YcfA (HicA-like mRNA interferase family)